VYQAFYDDSTIRGFLHSHSYTGNPLACSAALATLAIFEADDVLQKNREKSTYIQAKMQALAELPVQYMRTPGLQNTGMIFAFDVITQNGLFAKQCYQAAMQRGLLLRPIGNTVYLMPPYTVSEPEIDFMINNTLEAVNSTL
jgi:adenosylmethionine-8-amino-7-oxononanoate aminotransferase